MLARLESIIAEFGLEIQSGGVKGRGGMDAIFTLKQVLSKRRQHGQDTWGAFVDLKKAFPSIPRHVLFCVLRMFGVPPHFIQVLKRFYTDLMIRVENEGNDGACGEKQGCAKSEPACPGGWENGSLREIVQVPRICLPRLAER